MIPATAVETIAEDENGNTNQYEYNGPSTDEDRPEWVNNIAQYLNEQSRTNAQSPKGPYYYVNRTTNNEGGNPEEVGNDSGPLDRWKNHRGKDVWGEEIGEDGDPDEANIQYLYHDEIDEIINPDGLTHEEYARAMTEGVDGFDKADKDTIARFLTGEDQLDRIQNGQIIVNAGNGIFEHRGRVFDNPNDLIKDVRNYEKPEINQDSPITSKFEVESRGSWEKPHTIYGKDVQIIVDELNEAQEQNPPDIDKYMALLKLSNSLINSLITEEHIDDPVSFLADANYSYIWNNTHLLICNGLIERSTSLSDSEKNDLTTALLTHINDDLGTYSDEIEFDRISKIFGVMKNSWTDQSSTLIQQFYERKVAVAPKSALDIEDPGHNIMRYCPPHLDTYCGRLQRRILKLGNDILDEADQAENPELLRNQIAELATSMMDDHIQGTIVAYEDIFNKVGHDVAVPPLLDSLKSTNPIRRRLAAEILYGLELGKIGVSKQGANYLGKLYDLGTYNDPDYFVRRINSSGTMAVVSEQSGNLEGVFPLDIESEDEVISAKVRKLTSKDLFIPKADETDGDRAEREYYTQLFLENYESLVNSAFFNNTGVRLNSLELHEQGWFVMHYLELKEQGDVEGLERLQKAVTEHGEYALKSFLTLEYGGSGDDILEFAESEGLSKMEKDTIFKNFYAIANQAYNWRDVFAKAEEGRGIEFAPQVHEAFIRKNAEFFKAAQIIARGDGGDVTIPELLQSMNSVAYSMHALQELYKDDSNLKLSQKPQSQDEYDANGNLLKNASTVFILEDDKLNSRVVVSIRPEPTVKHGKINGGEARINFSVTNTVTKEVTRIGFDLSDYGEYIGDGSKPAVVSLDMGIGKPNRVASIWPSQRVGRVLSLVEDSEGGHNEMSFRPETAQHFPAIANQIKAHVENKFVLVQ